MSQPVLFDDVVPESGSAALAKRQLGILLRRVHPISGHPLHPQSATPGTGKDTPGLRCRDCFFAVRTGVTFKCGADQGKYVTHNTSTDLMLWFPACTQHVEDTPLTDGTPT
ncbi:MAG: hypothetical protein ACOH10_12900 [Rhodoglobus sp.]